MDDLIRKDATELSVKQRADKLYNIEKIGQFTHNSNNYFMVSKTDQDTPYYGPVKINFSPDYYNLIVYGDDPGIFMQSGHITLTKDRCLVEDAYILPELKEKYYRLTEANIEELKTFLCIFASENKYYGWTYDEHIARIGILEDIKIRSNGIELYYQPSSFISQARLNEVLSMFDIKGKYERSNELNHTHWTVKAINLKEAIHDARIEIF